jgi:hypothetical protein
LRPAAAPSFFAAFTAASTACATLRALAVHDFWSCYCLHCQKKLNNYILFIISQNPATRLPASNLSVAAAANATTNHCHHHHHPPPPPANPQL